MFEDSLFASAGRVASPRVRWTAAASIVVQVLIASLHVVLPLFHTERLPERGDALKVVAPLRKQPPPPPRTVVQRASSGMASLVPVLGHMLLAPRITPNRIDTSPEPANIGAENFSMDATGVPAGVLVAAGSGPIPVVRVTPEKQRGPVRVSNGVTAGLLLQPIRPVYPAIAKAAHVEGVVCVEAMISKAGTIESLHIVSGPPMLQSAAMEAIRSARYRPFLLNGEPVEVQTRITVNFRMGA